MGDALQGLGPARTGAPIGQRFPHANLDTPSPRYGLARIMAARTPTYRPEIDGLRAVAVAAVVLFHADSVPFGGGFVGVDIFFVISGFLITSIIEKDIAASRFSFGRFYERRIRRIFPALVAVSAASLLVGGILFIPADLSRLGKSLIAMALFASNLFFREDLGVQGYFQPGTSLEMLTHTWSLAVEEQFYLVLPPALLLIHRYAPRYMKATLVAAIILSFVDSEILLWTNPSDAFYLITPRAWELLLGSLLAIQRFPSLLQRLWREVVMVLGAALIVASIFGFTKATPFPGAAAMLPCLGSFLILYAGNQGPSVTTTVLSLRPIVYLGRISYSLYLWHWPVFVVTKYMASGRFTTRTMWAALAISLIAAALSYRFIETPFRYARPTLPRRTTFAITGGAIAALVLVGSAIVAGQGLPRRFDARTLALIAQNLDRESDETGNALCDNFRREMKSAADVLSCPIAPDAKKKILFWGDSHAGELRPVVEDLYRDGALGGRGAVFAIAPACVPSIKMERLGDTLHCSELARYALERAEAPDIDTIVIFSSGYRVAHDGQLCRLDGSSCVSLKKEQALDILGEEYADYTRRLKSEGKRVIIALSDPTYNRRLPSYEILKATYPRLTGILPLARDDFPAMRAALMAVAHDAGASIFDARASLCDGDRCRYEDDGVSLYFDNDHIARTMMGVFHDGLRDALTGEIGKP